MAPLIPYDGRRVIVIAGAIGVVGAVGVAIGVAVDPSRALLAYLAAYAYVASIAVGGLVLLLAGHAMGARWMAPLRRIHESVPAAFVPLAVLFVPLALGVRWIYPWAHPPADLSEHARHALHLKAPWLNVPSFVIRGAVYLAIFLIAAELLRRWSRRRDVVPPPAGAEDPLRRERVFASAFLPAVGLAVTFAGFDWLMSLQPLWYSAMFGLYYFAGGFVAAIGLVALLVFLAIRRGDAGGLIGPNHFHALGRLLLAFTVFWAYTAYFQAFLINIADKPEEVTFYVDRIGGGWGALVWVLIVGQFALPFALLLPRRVKLRGGYVAAVAAWILAVHAIEVYWLVLPVAGALAPHPVDLAAFAAVGGLTVAACAFRQRGLPLVAPGDPHVAEGARYASPL